MDKRFNRSIRERTRSVSRDNEANLYSSGTCSGSSEGEATQYFRSAKESFLRNHTRRNKVQKGVRPLGSGLDCTAEKDRHMGRDWKANESLGSFTVPDVLNSPAGPITRKRGSRRRKAFSGKNGLRRTSNIATPSTLPSPTDPIEEGKSLDNQGQRGRALGREIILLFQKSESTEHTTHKRSEKKRLCYLRQKYFVKPDAVRQGPDRKAKTSDYLSTRRDSRKRDRENS